MINDNGVCSVRFLGFAYVFSLQSVVFLGLVTDAHNVFNGCYCFFLSLYLLFEVFSCLNK